MAAQPAYTKCPNGIEIQLQGHLCQIGFIRPDICNVRYGFGPGFTGPRSGAVLFTNAPEGASYLNDEQRPAEAVPFTLRPESEALVLESAALTLRVAFEPFAITVFDASGRALHRDVPGIAYGQDSNHRRYHRFALDGYTGFYGFGDKGGKLNKLMRRVRIYSCDAMGFDAELQDPLYKHIPFFIKHNQATGAFCGVFYDSPAAGALDLACEKSNYWPTYCHFTCDAGDLDYYIIAGNTPAEVVRGYTDLTGKTRMPPLSSLGHIASTMYYTELDQNADRAIESFVDTLGEKGYGCDWYHLSSGYTAINRRRFIFNWDRARFPDPARFVKALRDKGILLSPNLKPALLLDHPLYPEFAEAGAFLLDSSTGKPYVGQFWGGLGSFVDFTCEAGRRLWSKHLAAQLMEYGITDFWLDNNEYEVETPSAVCSLENGSLPAERLKPVFANLMCKTTLDAMAQADPNHRTYLLCRAGYAGIQRYAQTWTGDNFTSWNTLRYNILQLLSLGLSGVANQGNDISGFQGPAPDGELFLRWVQNGIFQPRFCIHSCNTDNTVTLPWSYPDYEPLVRDAFRLRYRLLYYFYSLFRLAATRGEPLMRPTFYEFPEDERCYEHTFDFMCGPALLVANVVEQGASTRSVYLPAGVKWFDWWTHRPYEGGQTITVDAPLGKIPLFYREGAIVPLVAPALRATPDASEHLRLLMAVQNGAAFTLYQDDGKTNAYQNGEYHETHIRLCHDGQLVRVHFAKQGEYPDGVRRVEIQLTGIRCCPLKASADGDELQLFLDRDAYEGCEKGAFYYDMQTGQSWLKYENPPRDYDLDIDFGIKDLVGM